ncbi:MAG: hypothetical protein ABI597_09815 [Gammaproteobacteria bacterium]
MKFFKKIKTEMEEKRSDTKNLAGFKSDKTTKKSAGNYVWGSRVGSNRALIADSLESHPILDQQHSNAVQRYVPSFRNRK